LKNHNSGTKAQEIMVFLPLLRSKKLVPRKHGIVLKKSYACWFNFGENFFTTHVKSSELLEKSKFLEQNPREKAVALFPSPYSKLKNNRNF
jgi:hypothetical protein